jgi:HPt (histidine-containing phosphotransfer) domain-containing protein
VIDGVDVEDARERLAGNKTLFLNSMQRFLDENDSIASLDEPNTAMLKRLHRMKGNAGLLGMQRVRLMAQRPRRRWRVMMGRRANRCCLNWTRN